MVGARFLIIPYLLQRLAALTECLQGVVVGQLVGQRLGVLPYGAVGVVKRDHRAGGRGAGRRHGANILLARRLAFE